MPLKLQDPRPGKSSNYSVRGTYLGVTVDRTTGTSDRRKAQKVLNAIRDEIERDPHEAAMNNVDATGFLQMARTMLRYSAEEGKFYWLITSRRSIAGSEAGSKDPHGRVSIKVAGTRHKAHRLAWLFHYGEWPEGILDHVDGNPANNQIENLRIATYSQNAGNSKPRGMFPKGVVALPGHRFRASIMIGGKRLNLGHFSTKEEAGAAYEKAASLHFGAFARCL